eukprot:Clim_evm77s156 gene=Clim_evmTU77s156
MKYFSTESKNKAVQIAGLHLLWIAASVGSVKASSDDSGDDDETVDESDDPLNPIFAGLAVDMAVAVLILVIICLIALALIVALIVCCVRRHQRNKAARAEEEAKLEGAYYYTNSATSDLYRVAMPMPVYWVPEQQQQYPHSGPQQQRTDIEMAKVPAGRSLDMV